MFRLTAFPFRFLVLILFILPGCRSFYVSQTSAERIDTSAVVSLDSKVINMVEPYKKELEASMNVVIAELKTDLVKEQPESNLGNHIAQITLESAEQSSEQEIDFAIMNYGGLRVPLVSAGKLIISDAYQIMPFDNYIVVMDLKGEVIQQLLDQISGYGGWPVDGIRFTISGGKAHNITIGNQPMEPSRTYSMAISDYLADGGDHLDLLKEHPYYNTGILLRDAIINAWEAKTADGQVIQVIKDGRVVIKNNE